MDATDSRPTARELVRRIKAAIAWNKEIDRQVALLMANLEADIEATKALVRLYEEVSK